MNGFYSRTFLQWIAVVTMLFDHIGCILISSEQYPELYSLLRIVGRLSFPIFCFLLAQGVCYTSNIRKYIIRIAVFAVLAEIPFNLALFGRIYYPNRQSVMMTLLIGLLVLSVLKKVTESNQSVHYKWAICFLAIFAGCMTASLLKTDYSFWGVLWITSFYLLRNHFRPRIACITAIALGMGSFEIPALFALYFTENYHPLSKKKMPKYVLYLFYPVHLLLLYGIQRLLYG